MEITCSRCGERAEALDKPPFKGELGRIIQEHTCPLCWQQWRGMAVKIINEYRLSLVNPEHQEALTEQLKLFLKLPGADTSAAPAEVGTPTY